MPDSQRESAAIDECHGNFQNDDSLRERLRLIDGIPTVTYELQPDSTVFVFKKLEALVQTALRETGATIPLADLAKSLLEQSKVSAFEAVERWGVIPHPYALNKAGDGTYVVLHAPFNATLGVHPFETRLEAVHALALLLTGVIHRCEGSFTYREQELNLLAPLDTEHLPARPEFPVMPIDADKQMWSIPTLKHTQYHEGFEPLTADLFERAKALDSDWTTTVKRATLFAVLNVAKIWSLDLELTPLCSRFSNLTLVDELSPVVNELRTCYPELYKLNNEALYGNYHDYQAECCYMDGWIAERDESFVFYLIGKLATETLDGEKTIQLGQLISTSLLRGDSLDSALEFGLAANDYGTALSSLAWRIYAAIQFLEDENESQRSHGLPIATLTNFYRNGLRKRDST